jgi:hypothetical protein
MHQLSADWQMHRPAEKTIAQMTSHAPDLFDFRKLHYNNKRAEMSQNLGPHLLVEVPNASSHPKSVCSLMSHEPVLEGPRGAMSRLRISPDQNLQAVAHQMSATFPLATVACE